MQSHMRWRVFQFLECNWLALWDLHCLLLEQCQIAYVHLPQLCAILERSCCNTLQFLLSSQSPGTMKPCSRGKFVEACWYWLQACFFSSCFVFSSFLFVMQLFMAHSVQPSTCMTCTPNPHLLVWNFPVLLKSYKIYIETLWTPWIPFACPPVKIYTKILTVHQLQNW